MKDVAKELVKIIAEFYSNIFTELSIELDLLIKDLENNENKEDKE